MLLNPRKKLYLAIAPIALGVVPVLSATGALSQETSAEPEVQLEEVLVTGTRIARDPLSTTFPCNL
jgi:NaMN:DMB phosphoribosyltransferase